MIRYNRCRLYHDAIVSVALLSFGLVVRADADTLPWKECLKQPTAWYGSEEAIRIAENVLLYQRATGGWPKNIDMAKPLSEKEQTDIRAEKTKVDSTIDNDTTYTQAAYLARVFAATRQDRFKAPFLKAVDYLLAAQYENGGWPQFYPLRHGYWSHITFNDDAMIGTMSLLREIARKEQPYGIVDEARRARVEQAVQKGTACILKCQVIVKGKRTVWCAQHDEKTLEPAPGRAYEKISLSGGESVGVVRFLMGIDKPTPEEIEAIQSAIAWFEKVKLTGIKIVHKPEAGTPKGYDTVVVPDPTAPPTWARFYEIGTDRPIFCGRDSIVKYNLAEIEYERRNGYAWYVHGADRLLAEEYPAWRKKHPL
jgi:PelA/Pel-15E family pectate lyase